MESVDEKDVQQKKMLV